MPLRTLEVADWLADPAAIDLVIDARSPAEYAEDHLPGAVNWPVLDDDERRIVGTLYKQVSPHEARKVGASMVARNLSRLIEQHVADRPREWRPLVYCWRGGQRSGTLAWILGEIGFRTARLAGGYKAFRNRVRTELATTVLPHDFRVLSGRTGSGKTRLLQALREAGAQVLDLEALARHRGSVLGAWPQAPQPTQKAFDTQLWQALQGLDPQRPVFVESESRKIGAVHLPDALLTAMRERAVCLVVEMPIEQRVELLLEEYAHFFTDVDAFCRLLDGLTALRGRAVTQAWQEAARAGRWRELFRDLIDNHYDPLYQRSMSRHFSLDTAPRVPLADRSEASLTAAARRLMQGN